MSTLNHRTDGFLKDRMYELVFNIDEAMHDYRKRGSTVEFLTRMNRILYIAQSYARIFDAFEIEKFSKNLMDSYSSVRSGPEVSKPDLLELSQEVRECLLNMTLACLDQDCYTRLYHRRALAISSAISSIARPNAPVTVAA